MAKKESNKDSQATKSTPVRRHKVVLQKGKRVLQKRIDLPVKGKLARDVKMPKWLQAIGAYFSGSWHELRQVRWPNRRASWGLTLAVIIFTGVFMALTVGLDALFELIVKRIIL